MSDIKVVYVIRLGRERGKGAYLTFRPRTNSIGQILYGGGSVHLWVGKQSRATRFATPYVARQRGILGLSQGRIVRLKLGGAKRTRSERAEMAGRESALREVEVAIAHLYQKDERELDFTLGFNQALPTVRRLIGTLRDRKT